MPSRHHGRGIAARILEHIMDEARRRRYQRLSLETGSMAAFVTCSPFAGYRLDPNSVFMTREL
ncbi:MAG: GNAT family N-acetyltransferase [Geminicoccaceae bacterium]